MTKHSEDFTAMLVNMARAYALCEKHQDDKSLPTNESLYFSELEGALFKELQFLYVFLIDDGEEYVKDILEQAGAMSLLDPLKELAADALESPASEPEKAAAVAE